MHDSNSRFSLTFSFSDCKYLLSTSSLKVVPDNIQVKQEGGPLVRICLQTRERRQDSRSFVCKYRLDSMHEPDEVCSTFFGGLHRDVEVLIGIDGVCAWRHDDTIDISGLISA